MNKLVHFLEAQRYYEVAFKVFQRRAPVRTCFLAAAWRPGAGPARLRDGQGGGARWLDRKIYDHVYGQKYTKGLSLFVFAVLRVRFCVVSKC